MRQGYQMEHKDGIAWLAKRFFEAENRKMITRVLLAFGGPELVKEGLSKPMSKTTADILAVAGRCLYISGASIDDQVLKFFEDEQEGDCGKN